MGPTTQMRHPARGDIDDERQRLERYRRDVELGADRPVILLLPLEGECGRSPDHVEVVHAIGLKRGLFERLMAFDIVRSFDPWRH